LKETKGAIVGTVVQGSPEQLAGTIGNTTNTGFRGADIIVGIDNKQVKGINDIINYVDTKLPEQETIYNSSFSQLLLSINYSSCTD
jgi:S1-C subfamily serine protease